MECGGSNNTGGVINVPGVGPRIRIGVEAETSYGAKILASERTLIVEGAGIDIATYVGELWVGRARIRGWTEQYSDTYSFVEPCGGL
jgi:hypothetical protein